MISFGKSCKSICKSSSALKRSFLCPPLLILNHKGGIAKALFIPKRPINRKQALVSINPKNCNDRGRVTKDLSGVSVKQTNDDAVINRLVLLIINAWQSASR